MLLQKPNKTNSGGLKRFLFNHVIIQLTQLSKCELQKPTILKLLFL